jgi:hypothetical protein
MTSHVGTIVIGGFPPEKQATAEELGGQPREVSQMLTFSLSKASPGVYSAYRNVISCLALL